ncbi:MAG: selenoneine biosynthesis selenosugar synthase SenB [Rhodoferax sp.]
MNNSRVLIISPAAASANNGNWHTAWRWSQMLRPAFDVTVAQVWNGEPFDVMLALHARRSADSIARWAQSKGANQAAPGLGVVLTGTDLYRDIEFDASAQASLRYARQLVVLQERGMDALPAGLRPKTRVIFQSTAAQEALVKPTDILRVLMVGHLRHEKSPQTLFDAAHLLKGHVDILIEHIGNALKPDFGAQASACMVACPQYHWLGGMGHGDTLQKIAQAHVLVNTSRMEGGANVILEAVCSGTPVLASRIPGNVGMLGADYGGYFALNDAAGLANLLLRCRAELDQTNGYYAQLSRQCALRTPLFSPATEQAALRALVNDLFNANT